MRLPEDFKRARHQKEEGLSLDQCFSHPIIYIGRYVGIKYSYH